MANDEPPYLNVGTDVSAKYKGAFCEAKIKKVNRVVKCKVTFKNNLGSFMVTDDLIKGTLRMGADVEAKHPEKNAFHEAVINKLQDYSQYTVVFDDGDETTLRRTSLCLKSGRHFAESPTLDQFPLTNPEHFGTPVIGVGKFKRKRRSTMNSSLDYESSDEEMSFPRKLKAIRGKEKDPDLGKVVSVDFGDRRKRDSWYPGLVVPQPAQSTIKIGKEEYLIRSFKDGKYYQVPKRDTREFNKETLPSKIENNALKQGVEKAILYLEKEELPAHWDKALFMGLELPSADEDSQDTDLDTSDDEPSEDKDRFVAQLYKFMDERGTPINKAPSVSNKDLNLHKLFKIMHKLGGFNKVTNQNKWKTVYLKMGLPQSNPNGPNQLKCAYKRYLQSFEDFYRKLGCTMVNNSRSTRGRHRSDRNFILTRTRDREATASPKGRSSKDIKDAKDKAEKKEDKKVEEKPQTSDKKDTKTEEEPKIKKTEEKSKSPEKKKSEKPNSEEKEDKQKKEDKPRLVRSQSLNKDKKASTPKDEDKKDNKTEKARTREDARKEKNESPEKKGTRSSLKMEMEKKEKEEVTKERKDVPPSKKDKKEDKPLKDIKDEKLKDKKDEKTVKERKINKDKKIGEKSIKDKNETPPKEKNDDKLKEKRDSLKDSKDEKVVKGRKEENKVEEKSPLKKKLDRVVKEKKEEKIIRPRRENKSPLPDNKKNDEPDIRIIKEEKVKSDAEVKKEESSKEKPGPKLRERREDTPYSEEGEDNEANVFDDKDASQDEIDKKGPGPKMKEDPDEPPNKGKRRALKLQDDKDLEDVESDSDDEEHDRSMKDLKNYEIELGDRVKVKYGRGRLKKVYDAKVLKIQNDGGEKRYFVHYNGWNNRYDEWVRRNFIVALVNPDNKQSKEVSQKVPSQSVKRIDRGRPPGPINQSKPTRKNSTSSTNSSLSSSRATRSDKKSLQSSPLSSGVGQKRRVRRKSGLTGLTDTSQDSDSDNEEVDLDDDDVGDADVEDNATAPNDICFKEELFSDDEEKEKLEDVKRDGISELEKSIPTEENSEYVKDSLFHPIKKNETDTFLKTEILIPKEEPKKLKEDSSSEPNKESDKPQIKSEIGTDIFMTVPTALSVKLTLKETKTPPAEMSVKLTLKETKTPPAEIQVIQQPETSRALQPQTVKPTPMPDKEFKTLLSEKLNALEAQIKTDKVVKAETQEKTFKTQLFETAPTSELPDKISKQLPQKNSKAQMPDKESKIQIHDKVLKIQLADKTTKIHHLLSGKITTKISDKLTIKTSEQLTAKVVSEKVPLFQTSEKTPEVKKIAVSHNLIMPNINKNIIKPAEVTPVTVSSEAKTGKALFLSLPPKTTSLLTTEQNKKDSSKSSIDPISSANSESRNLSFSGLHGLINTNSLEKSTPLNKSSSKDTICKSEVPKDAKAVPNQPPKIDKAASEPRNVPTLLRTEKAPLFASKSILNPPKLSELCKAGEKTVLKSSMFLGCSSLLSYKEQQLNQSKTITPSTPLSFKSASNFQKETSKEKTEQKNEEAKSAKPVESGDRQVETTPFKSILGNMRTSTPKPDSSTSKLEKSKDNFDLLVESSSAIPSKTITDNRDSAFSLTFSTLTSKEKLTPEQSSNKVGALSTENLCSIKPKRAETFDLSKTIPSIIERLKKDVIADVKGTESPPPQKEELNFNFLRGSQDTTKSLSRSESSNSLRICEDTSDTNDSNADSKGLIINEKFNTSSVVSSSASDNAVPCPNENLMIQPTVSKNVTNITESILNSTSSQNVTDNKAESKDNLKTPVTAATSNKSPPPLSAVVAEPENESAVEPSAVNDAKEIEKEAEPSSKVEDVDKIESTSEAKLDKCESENSVAVANEETKSENLIELKNEELSNSTKSLSSSTKSEKSNEANKCEKASLFDDLLKIKNTNTTFSQNSVIMWNSDTKDSVLNDENPSATSEEKETSIKEDSFPTISEVDQSKTPVKDSELPVVPSNENDPSEKNEDDDLDSIDATKETKSELEDEIQDDDVETTFLSKKEAKKKRLSKKLKKFGSSEGFDKDEKEFKIKDGKNKSKKRRLESEDFDKNRDPDQKSKSKKIKKNKNKKRLAKHDDMQGEHKRGEGDDDHKDISDKIKKKEKKKNEKKFFKSGIKGEFSDSRVEIKKKKGKKNRDKLSGDKKDFLEKKTKKKKKPHIEENLDTDSEKDVPHKSVDKKKKKDRKKFKAKDNSSSSDDAGDKYFKEQNKTLSNLPSNSKPLMRQDSKSDDPDMSFLLCEEKVPASPVGISNMADDTSGSSSLEGNQINSALDILPLPDVYPGIDNIESSDTLNKHSIDTRAVLDNTPPTTPSSTESLLSSSPSHERDSFSMNYPESTQSGRDSGEGESDVYRVNNSNRTIMRGSDEYHAATTLAFAVCKTVPDKSKEEPSQNFLKRQKSEADEQTPSKRKKKSKRVRRCSESAKSPRHKSSYSRLSKFDICCEDSSGASPATSSSPPYSNTSISFSRSPHRLSCSSEGYSKLNNFYVHLHEKDPEKRIALLQEKMAALRKEYMELRSKFIALDHKRRRARKKIREAGAVNANPSAQTEDGKSCS